MWPIMRPIVQRHCVPFAAGLALVLLLCAPGSSRAQAEDPPAAAQGPAGAQSGHDADVEPGRAAPVLLGGEPVIWVSVGVGQYTPEARAARIAGRLEEIVHDRSIVNPAVTVTEVGNSSELRVQNQLLVVVTELDARVAGVSRVLLAGAVAKTLETAIRAERQRYAPATLTRGAWQAGLALLALLAALWLIARVLRWARARLEQRCEHWLHVKGARRLGEHRVRALVRSAGRLVTAVHVVLVLVALDAFLTYAFGLFPWTRVASIRLAEYAMTPVRAVVTALVAYLPNLFFLLVIWAVFYGAIRLVDIIAGAVRDGHVVLANFPAEWADPTKKIVRFLLVALGVVVAFPYLPASSSPAFTGVSVFLGVLVSLASSSALSNIIAGLVLTYTRAYRVGDRVQVAGTYGDIVASSLLVTRIRTIKNEEITIPNGIVLGNSVTNYSREATTLGLILHTSVTIGYDAPWRTVHGLLIEAALSTPGILPEPRPFVWQTALNDFYVTYEINASTASPHDAPAIYADLHARIQDAFYAAGVEIMSPHYASLRDGNTSAIPEASRPPGYKAPGFRVEAADPGTRGSTPGARNWGPWTHGEGRG
jgi:small-conductance mechanosensitive channel